MASASQKKPTAKRKSTSAKGTSTRTKKPAQPQKQPIRREVWSVALLVLALCTVVSYCGISAIFIDWLALLLKGLFGYGYCLAGPAFLFASGILMFHHGRPVRLRVTCALLLPVLFGVLGHMIFVSKMYNPGFGILKVLWQDGVALKCGGAVSGALAAGSVAVFSKVASIVIFLVLFVVLLMAALRLTPSALVEKVRNRPVYEEEPEPEIPAIPAESPRRRREERARDRH